MGGDLVTLHRSPASALRRRGSQTYGGRGGDRENADRCFWLRLAHAVLRSLVA